MSKQRPSGPFGRPAVPPRRGAPREWAGRVFKNSYTRGGRRFRLRVWSVKIQHRGRRHTFSLGGGSRDAAAREAYALYRTIVAQGWDAALRPRLVQLSPPSRPGPTEAPETQARYWRRRLLTRRYTEGLQAHLSGELSARIEHAGESHYFPLGTADEGAAAHRAAEIYRALLTSGWPFVRQTVAREITVAVFWATNPVACTYATVFTEPTAYDTRPPGHPGRDAPGLVCVVDGDAGVRRAVTSCVAIQLNGWDVATLSTAEEALWMSARVQRALVLLNRNLPDMAGGECAEKLRARYPELPAFTYGIYDESDGLFLSFAGVSGGYILRRRPPAHLLEPIGPLAMMRACSPDQLAHRVRRYFQSFFGAAPVRDVTAMARLTPREQEILEYISKGYIDREIAKRLGISAWTVHGHLQSIFRKLDVHTRTEAVVTYLQK